MTNDEPHEQTRVASPAAKRKLAQESAETSSATGQLGHGSGSGMGSLHGTASSPLDVLHKEEVERTRVFAQLSLALCVLLVIGLPFFGGNATIRYVFIGALTVAGLHSVWLASILRDPARYDVRVITALALWASATTYVGVCFVGIFSLAPTAPVIGIYFFSRSQSHRASLLIYGLVAATQGVLAVLFISGATPDPGIFTAAGIPLRVQIFLQILVQAMFFIAYALSRSTRASSLRAINDLQKAMIQVSHREALFQEVRQDLDHALMLNAEGRHSTHKVGSYKLGSVIGRGAMAEVYEAVHVVNGERAAIKILYPNVLESEGAAERFLREAAAAGALDSPNAVRVIDASGPDEQLPYLAMELLEGHDLAYWLRKRRRLSIPEVVELVNQVAGVIDLACEQTIVHRDLKPQNLFRHEPSDGLYIWKILDFGMSTLGEHAGTLTGGHVVGTPAYMAPEQARAKKVDSRADLYSIAAIAYRCLTGRAPFSGKDVPTLLYSVVYDMPSQPSSLAKMPRQMDDVFAVAMAKKRSNRFESGRELAEAFAAAADNRADDWLQRRAEALLLERPWGKKG